MNGKSQEQREKNQRWNFFMRLTLPILLFSLILNMSRSSELDPDSHFNSRHVGVGARGVNYPFKFYSQGAMGNKLPEPDGRRIKGGGRKACLL